MESKVIVDKCPKNTKMLRVHVPGRSSRAVYVEHGDTIEFLRSRVAETKSIVEREAARSTAEELIDIVINENK